MSQEYDGSKTVALPAAGAPSSQENTLTFAGQGPRPDPGEAILPVIDGYEITRELGRGGMGVVYLARQTKLNREVALKMVIAGGQASAADRARFLFEAEIAAGLRHPGIVQIHDFGTFNGQPYFALEYCPNGSLANRLNGQPMEPLESAGLILRLAEAIDVAHRAGTIHRDLKPANILMAEDGSPKITDFGLARRSDSSQGLTATGAVLGTPGYMAPEQAEGRSDIMGPATDVYSLGSILYECLAGRPPFRAANAMDTMMQVIRDEPVPPSKFLPKIPRDLETICLKCLRKDPSRRYASGADLADDLRRFLSGEPISARPVSWIERGWKLIRRHPAITGVSLAGVLALLTITTVVAIKNRQLGRERNTAWMAEQEAIAEQKKNQRLVDVAIEQQERLIARITGVDWTGNQALVAERERILQDVAEFYMQLLREEADDPLVRRKNADAHLRLAMLQIHRGDYATADESIRLARQSLPVIESGSPIEDPDTLAALAKAESAAGHLAVLQGDLKTGSEHYHRAAELAEDLVARHSGREEDKMLLMECYLSLVQYYTQMDAAKAAKYGEKIAELGERGAGEATSGYQTRLIKLAGLFQKAQGVATRGDFNKASAILDEAAVVLEKLNREHAPNSRSREIAEQFSAQLASSRGLMRLRTDKSPEAKASAISHLKESLARYDRVLKGNPKSIPFQLSRLNMLLQLAVVQEQVGDQKGALESHAKLDAAVTSMQADHPKMTWLTEYAAVSRSVLLIGQLGEGRFQDFEEAAGRLLDLKERSGPQMSSAKYNVACAYSLASLKTDEKNRERYQKKAVEILDTIRRNGYFSTPVRINELRTDADFAPIRMRADFQALLQGMNPAAAGKP